MKMSEHTSDQNNNPNFKLTKNKTKGKSPLSDQNINTIDKMINEVNALGCDDGPFLVMNGDSSNQQVSVKLEMNKHQSEIHDWRKQKIAPGALQPNKKKSSQ